MQVDWEQLIREIRPRLRVFLSHHHLDGIDVDDLVQETLLRVFTQYRRYEVREGQFSSWLYAVARNTVREHMRRAQATKPAGLEGDALALYVLAVSAAFDPPHRFFRGIGRIVQSAFNALRGRATFHIRKMAQGIMNIFVIHRAWYLLHGAHPPRFSDRGTGYGPVCSCSGRMCSRPVPST